MDLDDLELVAKDTLRKEFPNADIKLEETAAGRLSGYVISKYFEGKSQLKRQDLVWRVLRKHFGPRHLRMIASLLTMTPDEAFDNDAEDDEL